MEQETNDIPVKQDTGLHRLEGKRFLPRRDFKSIGKVVVTADYKGELDAMMDIHYSDEIDICDERGNDWTWITPRASRQLLDANPSQTLTLEAKFIVGYLRAYGRAADAGKDYLTPIIAKDEWDAEQFFKRDRFSYRYFSTTLGTASSKRPFDHDIDHVVVLPSAVKAYQEKLSFRYANSVRYLLRKHSDFEEFKTALDFGVDPRSYIPLTGKEKAFGTVLCDNDSFTLVGEDGSWADIAFKYSKRYKDVYFLFSLRDGQRRALIIKNGFEAQRVPDEELAKYHKASNQCKFDNFPHYIIDLMSNGVSGDDALGYASIGLAGYTSGILRLMKAGVTGRTAAILAQDYGLDGYDVHSVEGRIMELAALKPAVQERLF